MLLSAGSPVLACLAIALVHGASVTVASLMLWLGRWWTTEHWKGAHALVIIVSHGPLAWRRYSWIREGACPSTLEDAGGRWLNGN